MAVVTDSHCDFLIHEYTIRQYTREPGAMTRDELRLFLCICILAHLDEICK